MNKPKPIILKTLSDIPARDLKNKRILLRVDFNVPLDGNNKVNDKEDWRIKAAIPTIKYLLKKNAKIILLAHLGRPKGKVQESLRLGPVQDRLSELLDLSVQKMPDCIGEDVEKAVEEMEAEEILLLENLRFHPEEETNNDEFSKKLANLGDIYINDAFSDCHRRHSSIVGITKFLPSYAGLLMEKEYQELENAINPKHPAVAVIGGAKIETKLPVVNTLAKTYDHVLVGGMIANEINKESNHYSIAANVILPAQKSNDIDRKVYDIDSNAIKEFSAIIEKAKSIVWNGPMGKFEEEEYAIGTRGVVSAIKKARANGARVLVGGGETINAVQKFAPELFDKKIKGFNISTGGGAMLEFLTGKILPGIEVLRLNGNNS